MNPQPQYFFYDDLQRLRQGKSTLDEATLAELKAHVALNCPDPHAAAIFADLDDDDWANIYPPEEAPAPVTTAAAIDTFLETYGHASAEEDALLERLIFNPTPDYSSVLEAQQAADPAPEGPDDLTSSRIDSFIAAHPAATQPAAQADPAQPAAQAEPIQPAPVQPAAQPAPKAASVAPAASAPLSESLAKIYIRQGKYQRAFEIISDLYLKNPEKSIYFADQLRFLKKLIIIHEQAKGHAADA